MEELQIHFLMWKYPLITGRYELFIMNIPVELFIMNIPVDDVSLTRTVLTTLR